MLILNLKLIAKTILEGACKLKWQCVIFIISIGLWPV